MMRKSIRAATSLKCIAVGGSFVDNHSLQKKLLVSSYFNQISHVAIQQYANQYAKSSVCQNRKVTV